MNELDRLLASLLPQRMADGGDTGMNWYQAALRLPSITTASLDDIGLPDLALGDPQLAPPAREATAAFGPLAAARMGYNAFTGNVPGILGGLVLDDMRTRDITDAFRAGMPLSVEQQERAHGMLRDPDTFQSSAYPESGRQDLAALLDAMAVAQDMQEGRGTADDGFGFGSPDTSSIDAGLGAGMAGEGTPWHDGGMVYADGGELDLAGLVRRDDGIDPATDLGKFMQGINRLKDADNKGLENFLNSWSNTFAQHYGLSRDAGLTQSQIRKALLKEIMPLLSRSDTGASVGTDGLYARGMSAHETREPYIVPFSMHKTPVISGDTKRFGGSRMANGGALSALDEIEPGSYVVPSDTVAAIGNGSTNAGMRKLGAFDALPVHGDGDGRSDDVPAQSAGRPLRLSDGEAVIPPHSVRAMGGPQRLDRMVKKTRKRYRQRLGGFGEPHGAGSYAEGGGVGPYNPRTGFRQNVADEPTSAIDALLSYFGGNLRSWAEPAGPGPEADAMSRRNALFGITAPPTNLDVAMLSGFGSPGIMAGPKAKTADLVKLALARDMAGKGTSADDILKGTGWFQGADKKWRFEIPDDVSRFMPEAATTAMPSRLEMAQDYFEGTLGLPRTKFATGKFPGQDKAALEWVDSQLAAARDAATKQPIGQVLQHDALYAAYPELRDMPAARETLPGVGGSFNNGRVTYGGAPGTERSTLLHELQHAIQSRENFAPGSSYLSEAIDPHGAAIRTEFARGMEMELAPLDAQHQAIAKVHPNIFEAPKAVRERLASIEAQRRVIRDKWLAKDPDLTAYRRVAGEVEARNVQSRMDMTPEQRLAKPPWETEDVSRDLQIILDNAGVKGLQMSQSGKVDDILKAMTPEFDARKTYYRAVPAGDTAYMGRGSYFFDNPDDANLFAKVTFGNEAAIVPVHVKKSGHGWADEFGIEMLGYSEPALQRFAERGKTHVFNRAGDVSPSRNQMVVIDPGAVKSIFDRTAPSIEDVIRPFAGSTSLPMDTASRMQRADELFPVEAYHATGRDWRVHDPAQSVRNAYGVGLHAAKHPDLANMFAGQIGEGAQVMPLRLRLGNVADADTFKKFATQNDWDMHKTTEALKDAGYDSVAYSHGRFLKVEDGRLVQAPEGHDAAYTILRPENIRSRFAAFDPAKLGSSDLMAGLLPFGLLAGTQDEAGR